MLCFFKGKNKRSECIVALKETPLLDSQYLEGSLAPVEKPIVGGHSSERFPSIDDSNLRCLFNSTDDTGILKLFLWLKCSLCLGDKLVFKVFSNRFCCMPISPLYSHLVFHL